MESVVDLSDAAFLSLIDEAQVEQIGQSRTTDQAIACLLEHFHRRIQFNWPSSSNHRPASNISIEEISDVKLDRLTRSELVALADSILDFEFSDGGIAPRITPENRIDWHTNPTSGPEWAWWLHRHHWWPILALAYSRSADERYAKAFVSQMLDWVAQNPPPPSKDESSPSWRLMEAALRMRVCWIPSFALIYPSPHFSDHAKLVMLRSIHDHGRFLSLFASSKNHLLRECNGLAHVGAYFPEFKEAKKWITIALKRIDREIDVQVNRDGSHIEVSTGYQWLAVDEFQKMYDLIHGSNLPFPIQKLKTTLIRMYRLLGNVARPDGSFPQLNDGFLHWSHERLQKAGDMFDCDDLLFAGSKGEKGKAPPAASIGFADAGLFVMRSEWSPDALYLLFDAGPYGGNHGHEDKLSIDVFAHGHSYITDTGSYTYDDGDPYRTYFVSSHGHNTLLVDGKSQVRRWHPANMSPSVMPGDYAHWVTNPRFDYVAAVYDEGYGEFSLTKPIQPEIIQDVVHTRRVIFLKPDYWIVIDDVQSDQPHEYQVLFHAHPETLVEAQPDRGVRLRHAGSHASLLLLPAASGNVNLSTIKGSQTPIQGWYSEKPFHKVPTHTTIVGQQSAGPASIATLLFPQASGPGSSDPVVFRKTGAADPVLHEFSVAHNGYRDTIVLSKNSLAAIRKTKTGATVFQFKDEWL